MEGTERRVVDQDLLLELLQLRPRGEAELVGQLVPDPLVRRQRIGLASSPVEGSDQQLPQALLEGVRRHGRLQLTDHAADLSETQARRQLGLDELRPCLFESCPVRVDPFPVTGGGKHVAAVPRQRRRTQLGGAAVVAGVVQLRRGGRIAHHGERIDIGRIDGELVAAIAADDHGRLTERPTQHGDLRLQRVAPGVDRIGGPQVLDQPLRAHHQAGLEREAHQQLR